jgi:Zn-dependent peptidase ImmA (M78 family)
MSFDLKIFSDKLNRYCGQYQIDIEELSSNTGIIHDRLARLIDVLSEPTGDEILILSDFFKCDYNFFISNEQLAPFEESEEFFRKNGDINKQDRLNILEFLFLCECQDFLFKEMPDDYHIHKFNFVKTGNFYKQQGSNAAKKLRSFLNYKKDEIPSNVFDDFRKIGIHVFRRKLGHSSISGLYIYHRTAEHCVLVNYDEDVYRQLFSVAHEVGHAILDGGKFNISKIDYNTSAIKNSEFSEEELQEIRANAFATEYLVPQEFLSTIPDNKRWNNNKIIKYSQKLLVNPFTLAIALYNNKLISKADQKTFSHLKIPNQEKKDPELYNETSPNIKEKKSYLLERGFSSSYVSMCFNAYRSQIISQGRLAEMLLCKSPSELFEISSIYN